MTAYCEIDDVYLDLMSKFNKFDMINKEMNRILTKIRAQI